MSKIIMNLEEFKEYAKNSKDENLKIISSFEDISTASINYYLSFNNINIEVFDKKKKQEKNLYMHNEPKVSFLFTSYNRRELLQIAIESILTLDYSNLQIIIVDDASIDSTKDYILNLKKNMKNKEIIFIETEGKQGPGLNKRLGFDYVDGDYVVFMDDDDFYVDSSWLKKSIELFRMYPTVASIYFQSYKYYVEKQKLVLSGSKLKKTGLIKSEEVLKKFMIDIPKPNSTFPAIFDLKKYLLAGAKEMKILNDTQIYLRGLLGGDVYISENIVGVYRIHKGSISKKLSIDFILDNLTEKKAIVKHLPKSINKNEWLYKQSLITWQYYLEESQSVNYRKLLSWSKVLTLKYRLKFFIKLPIIRIKCYRNLLKHLFI